MAKAQTFGHPDGPGNVTTVTNLRRGRWQCQDVTERESEFERAGSSREGGESATHSADQHVDAQRVMPNLQTMGSSVDRQGNTSNEKGATSTSNITAHTDIVEDHQDGFLPTTSDSEAEAKEIFPPSLDSNSNASPRRCKSRKNNSEGSEDRSSNTESSREEAEESLNRTEIMMVALVVCLFLLPTITPLWSATVDTWNILHILWRMVFQGITVAFLVGVVLLGIQVHFSSYELRRLVAQVFHLELKDDNPQPVPIPSPKPVIKFTAFNSPPSIGDGDKASTHTSATPLFCGEMQATSNRNSRPEGVESVGDSANTTGYSAIAAKSNSAGEEQGSSGKILDQTTHQTTLKEQKTKGEESDKTPTTPDRRYKNTLKKMFRKFRLIRRKYKSEMWNLKRTDREASVVLSRVQLALPSLEREKQALLGELEAIHKQHEEEKRRNHDLLVRLQRLNQHFTRVGTPQSQDHQGQHYDPPRQLQQSHGSQQMARSLTSEGQKEGEVKLDPGQRNKSWPASPSCMASLGQQTSAAGKNSLRPQQQHQQH